MIAQKFKNAVFLVFVRLMYRLCRKCTFRGLTFAVSEHDYQKEKLIFRKMKTAAEIIRNYAPKQFEELTRDIDFIFISKIFPTDGTYFKKLGMVHLHDRYVVDEQTTCEDIACALIHEAQHARLDRLGFGYEKDNWWRIERICFRAQRNFARKLPGAENLAADAEAMMENARTYYYSRDMAEAVYRRRRKDLIEVGGAKWELKLMDWRFRRGMARKFD